MNEKQYLTNPALLGAMPSPRDLRDYVAVPAAAEDYPESFAIDLGIAVKNQTGAGSCVAHSLSELVEYFTLQQEGAKVRMSTNYIYGNRDNSTYKGRGMITRDAIKNLAKFGDLPYESFPGNDEIPTCIDNFAARDQSLDTYAYPNRISEYYQLQDDASIKSHLMHVGPVVACVLWPSSYQYREDSHLVINTAGTTCGGHCILVYGWDKNGWLFRNSWGAEWGDGGNAVWPYAYGLYEAWGVTDSVVGEYSAMVVKKTTKWRAVIQKVIDWVRKLYQVLSESPTTK